MVATAQATLFGLAAHSFRQDEAERRPPESVCVIGGGTAGLAFAQGLVRSGWRVSVVEESERVLPQEEPEAGELLTEVLGREGVRVLTGVTVRSVDYTGNGIVLDLAEDQQVWARGLLVTDGRGRDLETVGTNSLRLVRTSHSAQSISSAEDVMPRVTFTDPEIGAVGVTEAQARAQGMAVRIGMVRSFRPAGKGSGVGGFIKLVEDSERGILVGATVAGPPGGQGLSALTVAVHAAMPLVQVRRMVHAYPRAYRGVAAALAGLG